MAGARAALERFKVPGVDARATEYAGRNARQIVALIEAGEFTAFPNARCFILAVKAAGIPVACTCLRRTRMRSERAGPDRA